MNQLRRALQDEREKAERFSESPKNGEKDQEILELQDRISKLEEDLDEKEHELKPLKQKVGILSQENDELKEKVTGLVEDKNELARVNLDLRNFTGI